MGGCGTKMSDDQKRQVEANKRIERDLAKRKREMNREVKLLLLGTGASGKSTVAKQMQIIYLHGWGDKEKNEYKPLIGANLAENMQCILKGIEKLNLGPVSAEYADIAQDILYLEPTAPDFVLSAQHYEGIRNLWKNDQAVAAAFKRKNEFQLSDSALYFFNNIDKYADMSTYKPTDEDILRVRKRTTGIIETDFTVADVHFRMVDVGGQRNERKKWIHCFEDVTAILFVASMAEYDMSLEEDDTTNRMKESLHLFEETVNNDWFASTPVLLFLNKYDLFQQKIQTSDLATYFPDYRGGHDGEAARKFIEGMYAERNHSAKQKREFYTHCTTATDTKNILTVFDAVQDIFLNKALDEFNL